MKATKPTQNQRYAKHPLQVGFESRLTFVSVVVPISIRVHLLLRRQLVTVSDATPISKSLLCVIGRDTNKLAIDFPT